MQPKGWFDIPGVQRGDRTVEEQLFGLDPALADAVDREVLDLGCAEGDVAFAFVRAGAAFVAGYDNNAGFIELAQSRADPLRCGFAVANLNEGLPAAAAARRYGIVLLLAILHKLHSPQAAMRGFAAVAGHRLVIRLPHGSDGVVRYKHGNHIHCDTHAILSECGFRLEQSLPGPREERVDHWVRIQDAP